MDRLKDKVAIITGGNTGIGEATTELFAKEGAKVVIASINASKNDAVVKKLDEMGAEYLIVKTDISNEDDVRNCIEKTVKKFGKLDVMVNNAGVLEEGLLPVDKFKTEDYKFVSNINIFGTLSCIKYSSIQMQKQGYGSIVNIASIAGAKGYGGAVYCATKGAILAATKNTAIRFAGSKIRCNAICPGTVITPMTMNQAKQELDKDMYTQMTKCANPEVGVSNASDVANAILFFASDESACITGQELILDKGYTL